MLQLPNIYRGLKADYDASVSLQATVGGGLIAGWEKEGAVRPYAIADVTPGKTDWNTGNLYDQEYLVTITAWNSDSIQAAYALGLLFYELYGNPYYKLATLDAGCSTLQVIALPLQVIVEGERDLNGDGVPVEVFRVVCQFAMTLNELRPH